MYIFQCTVPWNQCDSMPLRSIECNGICTNRQVWHKQGFRWAQDQFPVRHAGMFCFSLMLPFGYEVELLAWQYAHQAGCAMVAMFRMFRPPKTFQFLVLSMPYLWLHLLDLTHLQLLSGRIHLGKLWASPLSGPKNDELYGKMCQIHESEEQE